MRFSKKFLAVALVFMMVFAMLPVVAFASDSISVTIDGVAVDFEDQEPIMVEGGRVLVPVSFVFVDLGFEVEWDRSTRTATLTRDDFTVVIVIGETAFTINGESHELDVPAQIIGGRTMVPLGPILRGMGYELGWSRSAQLVTIVSPPEPEVPTVPVPEIFHVLDDVALSTMWTSEILLIVEPWDNYDIIREAAEDGVPVAQLVLGMMYDWGWEVDTNLTTAIEWYYKAREGGMARAVHQLYDLYSWYIEDFAQSAAFRREAAEAGIAMSQIDLAWNYRWVDSNYEQAKYWFNRAAEQGLSNAYYGLGFIYWITADGRQDFELSYYWHNRAVDAGVIDSNYWLAQMYAGGLGVEQDEDHAIYLFMILADWGWTWIAPYLNDLGVDITPLYILLRVGYTVQPEIVAEVTLWDDDMTVQRVELDTPLNLDYLWESTDSEFLGDLEVEVGDVLLLTSEFGWQAIIVYLGGYVHIRWI